MEKKTALSAQDKSIRRKKLLDRNSMVKSLSLSYMVKEDLKKYGKVHGALTSAGFYVTLSYRIAHFLQKKKIGWMGVPIQLLVRLFTFCNIHRKAVIGPGLALPHPTSIFIGPHVNIGANCRILPNTFISSLYSPDNPSDYPVFSSGVFVGFGAVIMGGVLIGEGVVIGPNAVVLKDIPDFHNVMASPSRAILRSKDGWAN